LREGPGSFGKGPLPPLPHPAKDFRHRFIIVKDNLNVNSLERKWSPDRPRGVKSRKIHYLPELKANKSVQPPSYEYSTIFQNDRQIFPGFLPPNQGPWGRNCAGTKKFPQHFSPKLLIFITLPREAAATDPFKSSFVPFLCRFCAASQRAASRGQRLVAEYL
jgi:hypothetical protein